MSVHGRELFDLGRYVVEPWLNGICSRRSFHRHAIVMQERGIPIDGPPPPVTITEAFDLIRGRQRSPSQKQGAVGAQGNLMLYRGAAPCSVR
jgi:hypothetical protein